MPSVHLIARGITLMMKIIAINHKKQIGILTFTAVRQALRLCNCLSLRSLSPPLLSNRSDRWTGADLPTGVTCWRSVRECVSVSSCVHLLVYQPNGLFF
ncbi:hypothetical protein QQF64_020771 [Cirrhinus molitorella]|uniref:Uncharacterized protein n=1 Tax=Cirrhinus molitorella TaxID=172907 RepID=A0ABR3LCF2_9TELE